MAAASAPKDPTDDLHEQELPDFPDDGMHGMRHHAIALSEQIVP